MGTSAINGGFSIATFEYRMVDPGYPASSTTGEPWKPSASRAPPWVGKLCRFLSHCPCRRHNPLTLGKLVILPFETSANHVGHHVHPASNHKKNWTSADIGSMMFNECQHPIFHWFISPVVVDSYPQLLSPSSPQTCIRLPRGPPEPHPSHPSHPSQP